MFIYYIYFLINEFHNYNFKIAFLKINIFLSLLLILYIKKKKKKFL